MLDLSGDQCEHWCGAGVCVLASVPIVIELFSLVNVFCDVSV